MVDAALKERILARVAATPSPTRSQTRWRERAAMGLALVGSLTLLALLPLSDAAPMALAQWVGATWLALPVAMVAVHQAWTRGRSMRARTAWRYGLVVALGPYAMLLATWATGGAGPPDSSAGTFSWLSCAASIFAVALPPLVVTAVLRRDSEPERAGAMGAAMGVSAGAAAWILHALSCRWTHPAHLVLGHVLPLLLLGGTGELLGTWLMALRGGAPIEAPVTRVTPRPRSYRSIPPLS